MLIVQIAEPSADGHTYHRVSGPTEALNRRPGVTVLDLPPQHAGVEWAVEHADVLILHTVDPDLTAEVPRRRNRGQVTLLEACDHYFDIQPWSDYSLGWLDRSRQDQFWHAVANVDAVQTSTEYLAELWRPKARRVIVAPNALPPVTPLASRPDRPLTIGWAGSITHLADWFAVAPAIAKWVLKTPYARLAVMGHRMACELLPLPAERYSFTPLGTHAEYLQFLKTLDIAVVPLRDTPFNRGRTDLKFRDLAAAGVIGIFEANGPYAHTIVNGQTGWLYRTTEELIQRLEHAVSSNIDFERMRHHIHNLASQHPRDEAATVRWNAYRELLGHDGRNPKVPETFMKSAERRPTPRSLVALATSSVPTESCKHLEQAVALNPAYTAAWVPLVRMEPSLAERAAVNQPCNYLAALQAVTTATQLRTWLTTYAATAHEEEKPYLAAALMSVLDDLIGDDDSRMNVLKLSTSHFPDSAAMADRLGRSLHAIGDIAAAAKEFARAARIERIARGFALEYPADPPQRKLWAVGAAHA